MSKLEWDLFKPTLYDFVETYIAQGIVFSNDMISFTQSDSDS